MNKAGGLIFSHDQPSKASDVEVTFCYPLGVVLEEVDRNLVVKFGETQGIQGVVQAKCAVNELLSVPHCPKRLMTNNN